MVLIIKKPLPYIIILIVLLSGFDEISATHPTIEALSAISLLSCFLILRAVFMLSALELW